MSSSIVEQVDWLHHFIEPLNLEKIPYMVTGSVACILRGEPRLTMDVDLVIELNENNINTIISSYPSSRFYCPSSDIIQTALHLQTGHFNVIDNETGMKADFFICGSDSLHRWGMDRRKQYRVGNVEISVAPSEYVIIRKLEYFREGGSSKHLRDISSLLQIDEDIDTSWIQSEVVKRNLCEYWDRVSE